MGSDRKGFSRRRFLSTAVTSTAVSLLARPAFSSALSSLTSAPVGTAALDSAATSLPWKDQGVLNLVNSPYAKLHTVPVRAVTITEGFWSKRRKINVEKSTPSMLTELEQHGRMDNYLRLVGKSREPQK